MENIKPAPGRSLGKVRVGVAGWSYDDWKGVVYPARRPDGFHEAQYLAQYVTALEINTSFYRPLRPELARLWVQKLASAKEFRFTAKLYRAFTHERQFNRDDVRAYMTGLEPLVEAGLLGCVLMQFPYSFRMNRDNIQFVLGLAKTFSRYALVAEFRHAGWNRPDALAALADHRIGFCNIDQPQIGRSMPPTAHVTSPVGYVRFHGRNYEHWFQFEEGGRGGLTPIQARYDYLYSENQIRQWIPRIQAVAEKAETTYVIANNHFRGQAVVNALQVLAELRGGRVNVPPTLLEHYPELRSIAANAPRQGDLFSGPPRSIEAGAAQRRPIAAVYARA